MWRGGLRRQGGLRQQGGPSVHIQMPSSPQVDRNDRRGDRISPSRHKKSDTAIVLSGMRWCVMVPPNGTGYLRCSKPVTKESCLVTGLVEWPQVLDWEESLVDWVHFEAQK